MKVELGTGKGPGRAAGAALLLLGIAALGAATAPGCGESTSGTKGGESNAPEGTVAEGKQALTSAPVCLSIRRQGAAGTVFDAGIVNKSPPKNYGTSQTMSLGPAAGFESQVLLQFDLSAIPSGPSTNVTAATVNLARGLQAPTGPGSIEVHNVLAPWSEATVTWQSFGAAYAPASLTTFSNQPTFPTFGLQALVQGWVRGTIPNYGILLRDPGAAVTTLWTSEYGNFYSRPELWVCYTQTCAAGTADCNGNGLDGCETSVTTSAQNCGACGNACNVPNATAACAGGACQVGACNLGFGDCDGSAANGCETLLTTSTDCGACGVACAKPHGTASCTTGTCTLTGCNAGFFDCDGNAANGCEALPCGNGQHCAGGAGCVSGVCQGGFCATPACTDVVKNGSETAIDCGGGACPPCAPGLGCLTGADCQSGVCHAGLCQASTCADAVKNGGETAVDCGGAVCPACANGLPCLVGSDCGSGVCTAGVCQASACNDGLKNGAETAVDCGGGACPACASGKNCNTGADCADGVCQGGICQIGNCTDGVKNGAESDVDCGASCPPCGAAAHCQSAADCVSGVCVGGVCQLPTCSDGVKNGDETGLDCGGACFKPEVCNGKDDDCNGLIDEGLGSTTCGVGACQTTVPNCVGGQVQTCVPLAPTVEICDGLIDDDCDGVVDNGCDCVDGKTQSCYTASTATLGVGVCQGGVQTCVHGQWGACAGEVTPGAEACDGLDNDCNGLIDDGLGQTICGIGACQVATPNCVNGFPQTCAPRAPGVETCDGLDNDCDGLVDDNLPEITCGVGACQVTAPSCVNGLPATCAPGAPAAEVCDGIDNDCDGVADNGDPGGGLACSTGATGVCAAGTTHCQLGQIVCVQNVQPSAEACNGLDDNCDGTADNGNPGGGQACSTGHLGQCAAGLTTCTGGALACAQNFPPSSEICDGLDNDCDGVVDNGNPGSGLACATGALGVCAAGTTTCSGGAIVCQPSAQAGAEVCDGLDNDCDGVPDNGNPGGGLPCNTGLPGACGAGVTACGIGGHIVCVQIVDPTPETCDGVDNDCDGVIDNGNPGGAQACSTGLPGVCAAGTSACTGGAIVCNQNVQPSAETCDGLDNDCNGVVDDGNPGGNQACNTGHQGVCAAGTTACTGGKIACNQNVQPSAETCDGLDNDCNGVIDDGNPGGGQACSTGKLGICAAGSTVCSGGQLSCSQTSQPRAESCNGLDDDCDGVADNGDPGGGQACNTGNLGVCAAGTTACAAGVVACNQNVQPSAEACDGAHDENCDGRVDEGCACVNGQTQGCYAGAPATAGVGVCHAGTQTCVNGNWGACTGQVLPGPETCDGIDNDCNGQVDDGLGTLSCGVGACGRTVAACSGGHAGTCTPGAPSAETCDGIDNDCDGVVDNGNPGGGQACSTGKLGVCAAGVTACNAGALVCNQTTQPTPETCNGLDDNCNGTVDEGVLATFYRDADGDGFGNAAVSATACSAPAGYVGNATDCNDAAAAVHPGAAEVCNGVDDNCDGQIDEGVKTTYYRDADGDGYGSATVTLAACSLPAGYVTTGTDCNDGAASVHPGATEVCNGVDDNCNGQVDEGVKTTYYRDADGDGYGSATVTTQACSLPAGYVTTGTDCDDSKLSVHPGAAEQCNGIDDNCNGTVDEGNPGGGVACTTGLSGICSAGTTSCASGAVACVQTNQPRAETCNGLDDDCNGVVDNGNPGGGVSCTTGKLGICAAGTTACTAGAVACSQNQAATTETCNGLDDNCNGTVDEGVLLTFYRDADGDGFGNPAVTTTACSAPTGYVANSSDCNDTTVNIQTCGGTCSPCADGLPCSTSADCQSNLCTANLCVRPAPPTGTGLVGYWNLDQAGPSITDLSGNGNTGTAWNVTRVPGKVGFAYQFSGSGCISVADSASLKMSGGTKYTMMAWVSTQSGCTSDRGEFLNKENEYEMGVRCAGNNFDEATWTTTSAWFWTGYGGISLNTWQHVAVTWDGATLRAYSNGALAGSRALGGTFNASATGLGIGCRSVAANGTASGSSFFIGKIDEVAVYNRTLSATELLNYYNATK
jgi:hypothetical protein